MVSLDQEFRLKRVGDKIQMVDLKGQYLKIKEEIDHAIWDTISTSRFIGGSQVDAFAENLAAYLETNFVIPCGNGTDALQIALMALELEPGDEVIVPAFTYVATAEVIALLGLTPIMVDVDLDTFNISLDNAEALISDKTKAIIPVHLFGQAANMNAVMNFANKHQLFVIEDNAQSIGCSYNFNGDQKKTGTIGDIGTYSFFPSKNLGCYGDGGALSTNDESLAKRMKMIASHGQSKKYYHDIVGVNSRLDSIQAAILNVKLKYLDSNIEARKRASETYSKILNDSSILKLPKIDPDSSHVFHQYSIQLSKGRDELKQFLLDKGIPSMIYYPLPLYKQKAYQKYTDLDFVLDNTESLCKSVLSLPMHTELKEETISYISNCINEFVFNG